LLFKQTFKTHFKTSRNFYKKKNFLKNIMIFIYIIKCTLKNFDTSVISTKKKNKTINILRAPYRYKTSFSQVFFETYSIVIFFKFDFKEVNKSLSGIFEIFYFFKKFSKLFTTHILCNSKFIFVGKLNFKKNCLLKNCF
jgi:hypothetical protein